MRKFSLTFPEIGLIAATRGMLGAGIGLLVAGALSDEKRTKAGQVLVAVGLLTTVPLVLDVLHKRRN
jgi:hypothetical protein